MSVNGTTVTSTAANLADISRLQLRTEHTKSGTGCESEFFWYFGGAKSDVSLGILGSRSLPWARFLSNFGSHCKSLSLRFVLCHIPLPYSHHRNEMENIFLFRRLCHRNLYNKVANWGETIGRLCVRLD